jgi:RND family efflux transporter MFP subunit
MMKPVSNSPKRRTKWWLWVLLAVGATSAYTMWIGGSRLPEVTTAPVQVVDLATSFTAEGYVRGKDYQLSPELSGKIVELNAMENARVPKGSLLLRLDNAELDAQLRQAEAAREAANASERQARSQLLTTSRQLDARIAAARANVRQAAARLEQTRKGARTQEIDQVRHRIEGLRGALEEAEKGYERTKRLVDEGAISVAERDAAEAKYKSAKAALDEARANLELLQVGPRPEEIQAAQAAVDLARAELATAISGLGELATLRNAVEVARAQEVGAGAQVDRIKTTLPKVELRSPVDGIVSRVSAEVGTMASPGVTAVVISTRQDLRIEAEISSEDASKISQGMTVAVTSPAYPGRSFAARIKELSPVGELKPDAAIRTRIVRARVMLAKDWDLFRPGMDVDIEGGGTMKKALSVPSDAISIDGSRSFVFVVSNGVASTRDVKTGFSNVEFTEVLDGLKTGDVVVVRGKDLLKNGSRVREKP